MTATTGQPDPAALTGTQRDLLLRLLRERGTPPQNQCSGAPAAVTPDPARRGEPFPLTEIQQAYWIGRSAAYDFGDVSIHAYVEVDGAGIDLALLERSWQQLVVRHDMLRAVVLPDGTQRVLPDVPGYQIRVTDMSGQDPDFLDRALAATREEMSHQVLPAGDWPGFDIRATVAGGGNSRVHISIDLLHVDGGSLMILLDEWMRLYRDSGGVQLPPLELSYRDYVLGEIAQRGSTAYRQSAAYWQRQVQTLPPPPALPVAANRDSPAGTRFQRRTATLPAGTWQQLKEHAARSGLTPSAALLSAYADVLGCWSRDEAFTLNVTLFNRLPLHPQVNQILGDFTSMILLGIPPAGKPFAERAATAQRELWAGLEHRHISGIQVLRDLAKTRTHTGAALMPVVFTSMLDLSAQGFRPPFASLRTLGEVVYSVTQTPQVWLDHQVWEEAGELVLTWDSVEDLFPPGLLDDMFGAYRRFLGELAEDPDAWQRRGRDHVPARQLEQRASVNDTAAPVPEETLLSLFLRQAAQRPDEPAVITSGRTLTYGQVLQQARRLARTLEPYVAGPDGGRDTLVAVVTDKGWEQAVAALGIHLAGAAYLPADPHQPAERLAYLLSHGQVRAAVTQPWLDQALEWPAGIARVCVEDDSPDDERDAPGDAGRRAAYPRPGDLSHVIYTSGSTGRPKGVMIEHRNVVNRITDVNRRLGVGPHDRVFALSALHHDLSVYDIFGTMAAGAAMVIPDADRIRDPGHWAELMAAEGVTIWNSVPAFLQMLVEYLEERGDRPDLVPRSLRTAVLAGDWIPVALPGRLKRLAGGAKFIASGGPTETTIWDIWNHVLDADPSWPSIPYGKPMDNTRYHVLNGALEPCPVWVPGQLCIAGAGLARGYWRDESRTGERFVTHPRTGERLYLSGDMGRYLPDGSIEFLGREDFQVKIGGHRIELGEVEAALQQHPDVGTAIVTAAGEPRQLTHLVAYVVPSGSAPGAAGGTPAGASGGASGKDPSAFKAEDLAGVSILDPVERIDFKLNQWGIRRDTDREAVPFGRTQPEAALRQVYASRASVREFAADPLPLAALGELLGSLAQLETDGLPKYRYPSGGGLYPVQAYVYVKPGRVADLPSGVYYHDPREHRLLLISPGAVLDAASQLPHNRDLFDGAAFAIFLIGKLAAVEPLYGPLARDFCLLEAGYMGQLLMTVAPEQHIGLCPVGGMDFGAVRGCFDLDDGHVLAHFLIGGPAGDPAGQQPPGGREAGRGQAGGAEGLAGALRDFLAGKLPAHMRPAQYVVLNRLPLTPNGKVDRQRLPDPGAAGRRAQPVPDTPPRNDTERSLAEIAGRILQADGIGVHQNFFDAGGTSLQMVQILNEIRKTFGREVPVTQIFRHPTISSLAGCLAGEEDGAGQALDGAAERAAQRRSARGPRQPPRGQQGSQEGISQR